MGIHEICDTLDQQARAMWRAGLEAMALLGFDGASEALIGLSPACSEEDLLEALETAGISV